MCYTWRINRGEGKSMVEVVAALIRQEDRILICQRPIGKPRALLWEFPGGKVEAGEDQRQALVRECREELGVDIVPGDLYMLTEHQYSDIHIRLSLYEARIMSGTLTRKEHHALRWVSLRELVCCSFCPADVPLIQRLAREEHAG